MTEIQEQTFTYNYKEFIIRIIHLQQKDLSLPLYFRTEKAHDWYKGDKLNFWKPFIPQLNKIDTL